MPIRLEAREDEQGGGEKRAERRDGSEDFAEQVARHHDLSHQEDNRPAMANDAGLLAYRGLDDALGLTDLAAGVLSGGLRRRNTRHRLADLLRQSVRDRLAA